MYLLPIMYLSILYNLICISGPVVKMSIMNVASIVCWLKLPPSHPGVSTPDGGKNAKSRVRKRVKKKSVHSDSISGLTADFKRTWKQEVWLVSVPLK